MVFEKQEIALVFNFLAVVLRLGILIICARLVKEGSFTIISTVLIFSIASGMINLVKVMYVGHLIKLKLLSLIRDIRLYILFMLVLAGSYVLIKQMFSFSGTDHIPDRSHSGRDLLCCIINDSAGHKEVCPFIYFNKKSRSLSKNLSIFMKNL